MSDFLSLPSEDRIFLCRYIGEQLGIIPSIVEKDFWVCRALNILFQEDSLNPYLCFRGGTSLSKAYRIIRRFSEDIDVALSPCFFAELGEEDKPTAFQSASQRDATLRKIPPPLPEDDGACSPASHGGEDERNGNQECAYRVGRSVHGP